MSAVGKTLRSGTVCLLLSVFWLGPSPGLKPHYLKSRAVILYQQQSITQTPSLEIQGESLELLFYKC